LLHALLILSWLQEPAPLLTKQVGDAKLSLEAELMGRAEWRDDSDLSTPEGDSDGDVRVRAAVGLRAVLNPYLSGFAEGLVSWGDSPERFDADLSNLYLDFSRLLGNWDLRAGRAEMNLADGRLVSSSRDWLFEPNAFDGLWVSNGLTPGDVQWQAWYTTAGIGPADEEDDTFGGFFADWKVTRTQAAELYLLFRDQSDLRVTEVTVAARWHGLTRGGLDWSLFGATQDGDQIDDRETWAQAFVLTLNKELEFDNHVGFEFGFATGNDDKPGDFKRFTPVYIDQHRYNGRADIFGFANLVDFAFLYWRPWNERWNLHADLHNFWRANKADDAYAAYSLAPYGITSTSSALGSELDLYAEGKLTDSLALDFGAAYFLTGTAMPSDKNQIWVFVSAVYGF